MKVVIGPSALDDLAAIGNYIKRDNPARARSFVSELRKACRDLGTFPRRFPALPRLGPNARGRIYGNYLIIYEVDGQVDVLAVVHAARDLDTFTL